jgi:hypothetical protein
VIPIKFNARNIIPTKNKMIPTIYNALFIFASKFVLFAITTIMIPIIISTIDAPKANIFYYRLW